MALQLKMDPEKEKVEFDRLVRETLNDLIVQKVLLVKAREDSIVITDRQIDGTLDEQVNRMIKQLGSQEKLEEYFGGTSLRQIRRDFRDEIEERLVVDNLKQQKDFEVRISRREIESFYRAFKDSLPEVNESVKISHILVEVESSPGAVKAAEEKTGGILARLKKGEAFAELAEEFSEDPGSAARGGDLGMMQRGDLVPEFGEVAFSL